MPTRLTVSLALLYQPLVVRPASAWSRGVTPQSGPPRRHQVHLLEMLPLAYQQKVHSIGQYHLPNRRRSRQAGKQPRCFLELPPIPSDHQKSTTTMWRPAQPRQVRAARRRMPLRAANLGGMERARLPLQVASPACVLQYFVGWLILRAVLHFIWFGLYSKCMVHHFMFYPILSGFTIP